MCDHCFFYHDYFGCNHSMDIWNYWLAIIATWEFSKAISSNPPHAQNLATYGNWRQSCVATLTPNWLAKKKKKKKKKSFLKKLIFFK